MSTERHDDRDQATLIDLGDDGASHHDTGQTNEPSGGDHGTPEDSCAPAAGAERESFAAHSFGSDSTFASDSKGSNSEAPSSSTTEDRPAFGPFSRMLNAAARVQAAPAQLANMAETANDVLNAAKNNPSMLADLVRLEVERGVGALGLVTPTDFVALRKRVKDAERDAAKSAKHNETLKETLDSLALRLAQLEQEIVDLKSAAGSTTNVDKAQTSESKAGSQKTSKDTPQSDKTKATSKTRRSTSPRSTATPKKTTRKRNTTTKSASGTSTKSKSASGKSVEGSAESNTSSTTRTSL